MNETEKKWWGWRLQEYKKVFILETMDEFKVMERLMEEDQLKPFIRLSMKAPFIWNVARQMMEYYDDLSCPRIRAFMKHGLDKHEWKRTFSPHGIEYLAYCDRVDVLFGGNMSNFQRLVWNNKGMFLNEDDMLEYICERDMVEHLCILLDQMKTKKDQKQICKRVAAFTLGPRIKLFICKLIN